MVRSAEPMPSKMLATPSPWTPFGRGLSSWNWPVALSRRKKFLLSATVSGVTAEVPLTTAELRSAENWVACWTERYSVLVVGITPWVVQPEGPRKAT